jgi:opacity protein-like surface antigen
MKTRLFLLAVLAPICWAESPIIIGVRGGVPLNDVIQTVQTGGSVSSSTDNYVIGPTLGIRLPLGLSVAADALFTRLSISQNSSSSSAGISASASSWEFPVLARLSLGGGAIAPFVGAGVSVRHLSDFGNVGPFLTGSSSNQSVPSSTGVGFVLGGGLQFKLGPVHVSPEIRYTHWGSNQLSNAFSNIIRTNSNQAQVLVGVTF